MNRLAASLALAMLGCVDATYHCTQDAQCFLHHEQGTCETTGFCSFSDLTGCPDSGRRYTDYAADSYAGRCVIGPPNLLPNPGFETDVTGWVGYFDSTSSVDRVTSQFHGGSASAQLTPAGNRAYIGLAATGLSPIVGDHYTATWWASVPVAGAYRAFAITNTDTDRGNAVDVMLEANTWTEFSSTLTLTTWASNMGIVFRLDKLAAGAVFGSTELVSFDDLSLEQAP